MEERQVLQHQEYKIDEKLLKEADKYTVKTFGDILRVLKL